jgi:hypothetical protein
MIEDIRKRKLYVCSALMKIGRSVKLEAFFFLLLSAWRVSWCAALFSLFFSRSYQHKICVCESVCVSTRWERMSQFASFKTIALPIAHSLSAPQMCGSFFWQRTKLPIHLQMCYFTNWSSKKAWQS